MTSVTDLGLIYGTGISSECDQPILLMEDMRARAHWIAFAEQEDSEGGVEFTPDFSPENKFSIETYYKQRC